MSKSKESVVKAKKFDNLTAQGVQYYLGKIQIWLLTLVMVCPLCVISTIGAFKTGWLEMKVTRAQMTQAVQEATTDASGMTLKDLKKSIAKDEKEVQADIWHLSSWYLKVPNWLLGAIFSAKTWDWTPETCVKFLSWLSWSIVSVLMLLRRVFQFLELLLKLDAARNDGKVAIKTVSGYNMPFTGRAMLIVISLSIAHALVTLGLPVWLDYVVMIVLLFLEWREFRANKGVAYETPRKFTIIEMLRDFGIGKQIVRFFDNIYGTDNETIRRSRDRMKCNARKLPPSND